VKRSTGLAASALFLVCSVSPVAWQAQSGPGPTRLLRDGIYTSAQMTRGQSLYNQHCASCHMRDLLGNATDPPDQPPNGSFTGTRGGSPPLRGAQFVSNWNGLLLKDLYFRIRVSMPQGSPGSLTRQENADILAFILGQNAYPAGTQELPPTEASLDDIRFVP
jgi:mono/diheme cytochrome c family protein